MTVLIDSMMKRLFPVARRAHISAQTAANESNSNLSAQPASSENPIGRRRALAASVITLVLAATGITLYVALHPEMTVPSARLLVVTLFGVVLALTGLLLWAWRQASAYNAQLVDRLDLLAHEDALTGITNRRGLDQRLPQEMARAKRAGHPLAVAMLDLDYFKRFNDRRGHGAGDTLLRGAAQAWRKQLRPSDLLARYGGEEFTLVLPLCDAEQAEQLIERLRPLTPERQTFSAGVAIWNGEDSMTELLRTADIALLSAKKDGRNRTMVAGREPQMGLPLRVA